MILLFIKLSVNVLSRLSLKLVLSWLVGLGRRKIIFFIFFIYFFPKGYENVSVIFLRIMEKFSLPRYLNQMVYFTAVSGSI